MATGVIAQIVLEPNEELTAKVLAASRLAGLKVRPTDED